MKTAPGAPLSPEDVIGRDELIKKLWDVLEKQSVVLTAERRIGKTSIIRKMEAAPPAGIQPYFRDLERVETAEEFAQLVFEDVEKHLTAKNRAATHARKFIASLGSVEIGGIKTANIAAASWKHLLTHTLEDLAEAKEFPIVFFWDELPLMLQNIQSEQGERTAMAVLDTLRALRQTHRSLRMVYTGSIGLHHVLTDFKSKGYANAPTNDMYVYDVPPLEPLHAQKLARLLILGEDVQIVADESIEDVAGAIAGSVDNVPYYIHHIVDQLKGTNASISIGIAKGLLATCLLDSQDRWHLGHYRERLHTYYGDRDTLALRILDAIAGAASPLSINEILRRITLVGVQENDEAVRVLLTLLQRDHYLNRDNTGRYHFRLSINRRWWLLDRDITGESDYAATGDVDE